MGGVERVADSWANFLQGHIKQNAAAIAAPARTAVIHATG